MGEKQVLNRAREAESEEGVSLVCRIRLHFAVQAMRHGPLFMGEIQVDSATASLYLDMAGRWLWLGTTLQDHPPLIPGYKYGILSDEIVARYCKTGSLIEGIAYTVAEQTATA